MHPCACTCHRACRAPSLHRTLAHQPERDEPPAHCGRASRFATSPGREGEEEKEYIIQTHIVQDPRGSVLVSRLRPRTDKDAVGRETRGEQRRLGCRPHENTSRQESKGRDEKPRLTLLALTRREEDAALICSIWSKTHLRPVSATDLGPSLPAYLRGLGGLGSVASRRMTMVDVGDLWLAARGIREGQVSG